MLADLSFADLVALRDEAKEKGKWVLLSLEQAGENVREEYKAACTELINDYARLSKAAQTEIDRRIELLVKQQEEK